MADSNSPHPDDRQTATGNISFTSASARLPEGLGLGVYSTGAILMGAGTETVIDFLQGIDGRNHVVARVVLPNRIVGQLVRALDPGGATKQPPKNEPPKTSSQPIAKEEAPAPTSLPGVANQPPAPAPAAAEKTVAPAQSGLADSGGTQSGGMDISSDHAGDDEAGSDAPPSPANSNAGDAEPKNRPLSQNNIQDIYDDLRLPDDLLAGRFANKVIVRHTGVECVFDFISQLFPKPCVSARVIMATERSTSLLQSLRQHMASNRLE